MSRKHAPPFKQRQILVPHTGPKREPKQITVQVAVPSTGLWFADFGTSLCNMLAAWALFRFEDYDRQLALTMNVKGSILTKSRRLACEEAARHEADYLLFIDSDQTFPRKTLHKLLSHHVDCVACNIATKTIPAQPTARNKHESGDPKKWVTVYTDAESTGLEKVDRIGAGVMLLSRKAYEALKPGSFDMFWREDVQADQGEDWSMCEALTAAGISIYIDHDLSKEVGHVGFFTYTHDVVGEVVSVRDPEPQQAEQAQAVG